MAWRIARRMGLLTMLSGLLWPHAAGADTRAGIAAYQRADYETAMRELNRSAEKGDPQALYNLAVAYAEGKAVPRDMARALDLYQRAATRGSVFAAYNLGQMHRKGEGVGADPAEAARWYGMAAKRGDYRAANELGLLMVEGKGVPRDPVEGFAWIYTGTVADIMDETSMANAIQLAGMLTRDQIQTAQGRGQSYYKRYIAPNGAVVRAIKSGR